MALTDLVPWNRNRSVASRRLSEDSDPFLSLHREVNRMFDDFARGFWTGSPAGFAMSGGWPHIEVSETDKEVRVVAELPGINEKEVEITLADGVLTIKGEKKSESQGALYSERWHGQFQRTLQVGPDVDPERVSAAFKNGVLTVTLAKRADAERQVKRIAVTSG
jgi:HSP20 family protein